MQNPTVQQLPSPTKICLTALALGISVFVILSWRLDLPRSFFYDESLYVQPARAFLAGTPDTNPEIPPLGKYLVAAGIKVLGDNAYGWRIVGACFGAGTVVGIFAWLYLLLHDYALALTGALLTILNNFVYVMSRVAMMDIFLVGFLVCGLIAFTAVLEVDVLTVKARRLLMAFSGAMFGLASACKWNGIDTLGVVVIMTAGLLWLARRSQDSELLQHSRRLCDVGLISGVVCLVIVPVVAYALTFWPLCHSAHSPFGIRAVVAMNILIWKLHRIDPGNAFIASKWYSWPFQVEPQRALSYLVGNWVITWGGIVALLFCLRRIWRLPEVFVVLLYMANLLQWAITPQKHLYYYYYFPSALFIGAAIPVALHRIPRRTFAARLSLILVLAAGVTFLFCLQRMARLDPPFECALGCWP